MGYLYGDATESALDSNYLEFLKAAVDFMVSVLDSNDQIARLEVEAQERKRGATREREQLQTVSRDVQTTLQNCLARAKAPITNKCVHQIRGLAKGELERTKGEIEQGLERELSRIDQEIQRQRAGNHNRLEALLLEHDMPQSRQWVDYRVAPDGATSSDLVGISTAGLSWAIELDIPDEHLLHEPLRVDRLFDQMTIEVPEMSGWVRKRIKLKSYKLTKDHITGLHNQDGRTVLELRSSVQERDTGFDITFSGGIPRQIVRLYKGTASDPSQPEEADVAKLQELYRAITKSLAELRMNRRALKSARLDDKPVARHKQPGVLVERMVKQMTPVVLEISQHSLSPTELVLKRVLADDQRVEIFASKSELSAKIETLSPASQQVFAPLELDQPNPVPTATPPPVQSRPPAAAQSGNSSGRPAPMPSQPAAASPSQPQASSPPQASKPTASSPPPSPPQSSAPPPQPSAPPPQPSASAPSAVDASKPPPPPKRGPKPGPEPAATVLPGLFDDFDDEEEDELALQRSPVAQRVGAIKLEKRRAGGPRHTLTGVGASPVGHVSVTGPSIDVNEDSQIEVSDDIEARHDVEVDDVDLDDIEVDDEATAVMDDSISDLIAEQIDDLAESDPDSEPEPTVVRPSAPELASGSSPGSLSSPPGASPGASPGKAPPSSPKSGRSLPMPSSPPRRPMPPPPPARPKVDPSRSVEIVVDDDD